MSITLAIIIVTVLISYQAFSNYNIIDKLKHHPYSEHNKKEYYRMLSSGFVHGNSTHLLINMFVLYMFGTTIEPAFGFLYNETMGPIIFLVFYLSAIFAADIPSHFKHRNNYNYAAVGASGATSALVIVYCLLDPWNWFVYPPVPAIVFALGYIYYSHWAETRNKADGIGHSAHLYGALYGIVFIVLTNPKVCLIFFNKIMEGPVWPPPIFN